MKKRIQPEINLKAVQREWDKKLKDNGFKDIEDRSTGHLKRWDSFYFHIKFSPTYFQSKEEYYQAAGNFFEYYSFVNAEEKEIWKLHAEGKTIRAIEKKLRDPTRALSRSTIHNIIKKLESVMKSYAWKSKRIDDQEQPGISFNKKLRAR